MLKKFSNVTIFAEICPMERMGKCNFREILIDLENRGYSFYVNRYYPAIENNGFFKEENELIRLQMVYNYLKE